jgi:hypothetical protein
VALSPMKDDCVLIDELNHLLELLNLECAMSNGGGTRT